MTDSKQFREYEVRRTSIKKEVCFVTARTWEEAEDLAQDQEWEYVSEDTSFEAEEVS
jgi:hypothetical protein|tara:strand:+ start:441 stop:611 length:171 start_codon:yes stop_codon:yes gene_type:complete